MPAPTLRRTLTFGISSSTACCSSARSRRSACSACSTPATDGAVALVYVLATIAMAFTAWSYAEMSRVVPHAGSVFAYAREGPRRDRPGSSPAGWRMLDYLLIPSVAYLFSGIALHALVPAVPAWVFTVRGLRR